MRMLVIGRLRISSRINTSRRSGPTPKNGPMIQHGSMKTSQKSFRSMWSIGKKTLRKVLKRRRLRPRKKPKTPVTMTGALLSQRNPCLSRLQVSQRKLWLLVRRRRRLQTFFHLIVHRRMLNSRVLRRVQLISWTCLVAVVNPLLVRIIKWVFQLLEVMMMVALVIFKGIVMHP